MRRRLTPRIKSIEHKHLRSRSKVRLPYRFLILIQPRPWRWTRPLFTVTFDVNSSDNYGQFISNLRHRLANPRHFTHKRPVLPPVEPNVPPRRWFHIVLRTQQAELTLATRADNLYLEGFQSTDGTWWELTDGIIPGATYTRLGGSNYGDLIRDTVELSEVALGPQQMAEAMNVLAGRVPADMSRAEESGDASIKPTVVDNIY
ncbi:hypothetical protein PR202_ga28036 [Eleusine coracana subsp. coracana]|uniref:rRNA N-glycosylase n=1 Tax=Eleusine coracana subsp. coracana TaxID=191504 RepID=A0AAV5DI19_ELECO|nr:hypothetical protein PR202_ga28036 [Eleusine coracana subsp. coracana]